MEFPFVHMFNSLFVVGILCEQIVKISKFKYNINILVICILYMQKKNIYTEYTEYSLQILIDIYQLESAESIQYFILNNLVCSRYW